jgi:hypothetical protein
MTKSQKTHRTIGAVPASVSPVLGHKVPKHRTHDRSPIEASFQKKPDHYVGIGGTGAGQPSRYNRVGRLFQTEHPVYMPHLSVDGDDAVSFTDGRHRFAWIRDHGAQAIPVTAYVETASRLEAIFGTSLRECRVTV